MTVVNCRDLIPVKAHELLEQWLKTWTPHGKKVAVVYGSTGVGKTTAIRCIAEKLGYDVVTYDYSNWPGYEAVLSRARSPGWPRPVLIHLDRPFEEIRIKGRQLGRLIRAAVNPAVIETDKPKMYEWLAPAMIEVTAPPKTALARLIRQQALVKPNYRLVGSDVRQALLLAYGAETYETGDWIAAVKECLKTGRCEGLEESHLPVLLDSYVENCYGFECLKAIELLVAADISKRPELIDGFRVGHGITNVSMYFYKKWKAVNSLRA